MAAAERGRRAPGLVAGTLTLSLALAACCPATSPPQTAFTARIRTEGGGRATAQLTGGREVALTGVSSAPAGPVYVTGRLLPDGSVAVTGVRPLSAAGNP